MDTELMLDVGQANELKLAARRAGVTNADLKRLSEGDMFAQILPVIRGMGEVVIIKHLINCDASPFIPGGSKVAMHRRGGQLEWNPNKVQLYLSKQQLGNYISGHDLRKELAGLPVMNANVLDYLFAHQDLIPEEWKSKYVFFWGTIYRSFGGHFYVRCCRWDGEKWRLDYNWLENNFLGCDPAALLVS